LSLLLNEHPLAFVTIALVLGLIVGSFLNVLVWRLPKMLEREWRAQAHEVLGLPAEPGGPTYNLMHPNSCCPHCDHPIRPWGKYPTAQLPDAQGALRPLPGEPSSPPLPFHGTRLWVDLGLGRLAFRLWLAGGSGAGVELGVAGNEPDRRRPPVRCLMCWCCHYCGWG